MKHPIHVTVIEFLANEGNLIGKELLRLDEPFGFTNLGVVKDILFDENSGDMTAILLESGRKETVLYDLYVQVDSVPIYK